jgi:GNAT superfamily N-acetyltransferase
MTIRAHRPDERAAVLDLAARAFHDDPLFRHVYPDPARRHAGFVREHRAYLRWIYEPAGHAEIAADGDTVLGLVWWIPPDQLHALGWREWICIPAMLRAIGPHRFRTVWKDYAAFEPHIPTDGRALYVGLLAVDPAHQGRGVGRALMAHAAEQAARVRAGVYLETGTEANVAFYRACGLDVRAEIPLPHGPTHWGMWRPPASAH